MEARNNVIRGFAVLTVFVFLTSLSFSAFASGPLPPKEEQIRDAQGNVVLVKRTETPNSDSVGNPMQQSITFTDTQNGQTVRVDSSFSQYRPMGQNQWIVGQETRRIFSGNQLQEVDEISTEVDNMGRVATQIVKKDGQNNVLRSMYVEKSYDKTGKLISEVVRRGKNQPPLKMTMHLYDSQGMLQGVSEMEYDAQGRQTQQIDRQGRQIGAPISASTEKNMELLSGTILYGKVGSNLIDQHVNRTEFNDQGVPAKFFEITNIARDGNGNIVHKTEIDKNAQNGAVLETRDITQNFQPDGKPANAMVLRRNGSNQPLGGERIAYRYDNRGNVVSEEKRTLDGNSKETSIVVTDKDAQGHLMRQVTVSLDGQGKPVRTEEISFEGYTPADNPLQKVIVVRDDKNQTVSSKRTVFQYDGQGKEMGQQVIDLMPPIVQPKPPADSQSPATPVGPSTPVTPPIGPGYVPPGSVLVKPPVEQYINGTKFTITDNGSGKDPIVQWTDNGLGQLSEVQTERDGAGNLRVKGFTQTSAEGIVSKLTEIIRSDGSIHTTGDRYEGGFIVEKRQTVMKDGQHIIILDQMYDDDGKAIIVRQQGDISSLNPGQPVARPPKPTPPAPKVEPPATPVPVQQFINGTKFIITDNGPGQDPTVQVSPAPGGVVISDVKAQVVNGKPCIKEFTETSDGRVAKYKDEVVRSDGLIHRTVEKPNSDGGTDRINMMLLGDKYVGASLYQTYNPDGSLAYDYAAPQGGDVGLIRTLLTKGAKALPQPPEAKGDHLLFDQGSETLGLGGVSFTVGVDGNVTAERLHDNDSPFAGQQVDGKVALSDVTTTTITGGNGKPCLQVIGYKETAKIKMENQVVERTVEVKDMRYSGPDYVGAQLVITDKVGDQVIGSYTASVNENGQFVGIKPPVIPADTTPKPIGEDKTKPPSGPEPALPEKPSLQFWIGGPGWSQDAQDINFENVDFVVGKAGVVSAKRTSEYFSPFKGMPLVGDTSVVDIKTKFGTTPDGKTYLQIDSYAEMAKIKVGDKVVERRVQYGPINYDAYGNRTEGYAKVTYVDSLDGKEIGKGGGQFNDNGDFVGATMPQLPKEPANMEQVVSEQKVNDITFQVQINTKGVTTIAAVVDPKGLVSVKDIQSGVGDKGQVLIFGYTKVTREPEPQYKWNGKGPPPDFAPRIPITHVEKVSNISYDGLGHMIRQRIEKGMSMGNGGGNYSMGNVSDYTYQYNEQGLLRQEQQIDNPDGPWHNDKTTTRNYTPDGSFTSQETTQSYDTAGRLASTIVRDLKNNGNVPVKVVSKTLYYNEKNEVTKTEQFTQIFDEAGKGYYQIKEVFDAAGKLLNHTETAYGYIPSDKKPQPETQIQEINGIKFEFTFKPGATVPEVRGPLSRSTQWVNIQQEKGPDGKFRITGYIQNGGSGMAVPGTQVSVKYNAKGQIESQMWSEGVTRTVVMDHAAPPPGVTYDTSHDEFTVMDKVNLVRNFSYEYNAQGIKIKETEVQKDGTGKEIQTIVSTFDETGKPIDHTVIKPGDKLPPAAEYPKNFSINLDGNKLDFTIEKAGANPRYLAPVYAKAPDKEFGEFMFEKQADGSMKLAKYVQFNNVDKTADLVNTKSDGSNYASTGRLAIDYQDARRGNYSPIPMKPVDEVGKLDPLAQELKDCVKANNVSGIVSIGDTLLASGSKLDALKTYKLAAINLGNSILQGGLSPNGVITYAGMTKLADIYKKIMSVGVVGAVDPKIIIKGLIKDFLKVADDGKHGLEGGGWAFTEPLKVLGMDVNIPGQLASFKDVQIDPAKDVDGNLDNLIKGWSFTGGGPEPVVSEQKINGITFQIKQVGDGKPEITGTLSTGGEIKDIGYQIGGKGQILITTYTIKAPKPGAAFRGDQIVKLSYDDAGRIVQQENSGPFGRDVTKFAYDKETGQLLEKSIEGNGFEHSFSRSYKYDSKGRTIFESESTSNIGGRTTKSKTYIYGADGSSNVQEVTEENGPAYGPKGPGGRFKEIKDIKKDASGKDLEIAIRRMDEKGKEKFHSEITYEYNDKGVKTGEKEVQKDQNGGVLVTVTRKFDETGKVIGETKITKEDEEKAKKDAEEKVKEEQLKKEAEEKAKQDAEQKAKEEALKKEAEEKAKKAAEEKAKEEQLKKEAEDKAREEQSKKEEEKKQSGDVVQDINGIKFTFKPGQSEPEIAVAPGLAYKCSNIKTEAGPDGKSRVTSYETSEAAAPGAKPVSRFTFQYDDKGRVASQTIVKVIVRTVKIEKKDSDSHAATTPNLVEMTGVEIRNRKRAIRPSSTEYVEKEVEEIQSVSQCTYEYDTKGIKTKETVEEKDVAGVVTKKVVTSFDAKGQPSARDVYTPGNDGAMRVEHETLERPLEVPATPAGPDTSVLKIEKAVMPSGWGQGQLVNVDALPPAQVDTRLAILARQTTLDKGGKVDIQGPLDKPTGYTLKNEAGEIVTRSEVEYGPDGKENSYQDEVKNSAGTATLRIEHVTGLVRDKDGKEISSQRLLRVVDPLTGDETQTLKILKDGKAEPDRVLVFDKNGKEKKAEETAKVADKGMRELTLKALAASGGHIQEEKYTEGPYVGQVKSYTTATKDAQGNILEVKHEVLEYAKGKDGKLVETSYHEVMKDSSGEEVMTVDRGGIKRDDSGNQTDYHEIVTVKDKETKEMVRTYAVVENGKETAKATTPLDKDGNEKSFDAKGEKDKLALAALRDINKASQQGGPQSASPGSMKKIAQKKFQEGMAVLEQQLAKVDATARDSVAKNEKMIEQGQAIRDMQKEGEMENRSGKRPQREAAPAGMNQQ